MIRKLIAKILYPRVWTLDRCRFCDGSTFNGACPVCISKKMEEEE